MTVMSPTQHHFVHALVATIATQNPERTAVKIGDRSASYADLLAGASIVGEYLKEQGVGPETRVALFLDRSIELVVSIFGVFAAGGAYVPLDINAPAERIGWMLQDSGVKVVLSLRKDRDSVPAGGWDVVEVDSLLSEARVSARTEIVDVDTSLFDGSSSNSPDDLAYVIYTSGSTGRPKGVMISHRSLAASTRARLVQYGHSSQNGDVRTLLPFSFTFDGSIGSFWWTLAVGGAVVLPESSRATDVGYLVELVRSEQLNFADLLTTVYDMMLDYASSEARSALNSLNVVIVGAEAMPSGLIKKHYDLLPKCRLYNEYGPTEGTVWATTYLTRPGDYELSAVPIGAPASHVNAYVLDKDLNAVPVRQVGTLWLGGVGVARGYQNLEAQTESVFIAHPNISGERIYNTGDLVWLNDEGQIVYVGRNDHQIKLRGVRIELSEVENLILTNIAVVRAAVLVVKVANADYLVAYVEPRSGASISSEDVADYCRSRLPAAMVPSHVIVLKELPTLTSGKIDRSSLLSLSLPVSIGEQTLPETQTEREVYDIWRKVLKIESLGTNDNFFSVGGHSLLATQIVSRVRTQLKVALPMRILFSAPTVAELADVIDRERLSQQSDNEIDVIRKQPRHFDRPSIFPATSSQAGMWFLQNFAPESTPYNMPFALYLKGSLDKVALKSALNAIVYRHEVYRTSFSLVNGEPMQIVASATKPVDIEEINLVGMPRSRKEFEAASLARSKCLIPFDLSVDPLFRVYLMQLEHDENILLTVTHHTIGDQWSDTVLYRELSALYNAYSGNTAPSLPEPVIEYADYAVWQRNMLASPEMDRQLEYWKKQVDGVVVATLPVDRKREGKQSFDGGVIVESLSDRFISRVKEWSSKNSVTPFMTLLASYMVLLARYSAEYDIAVAAPIATRNRAELEDLVGSMVNPLMIRANFTDSPTFLEALSRVKEAALGAFANQDLPFEKIVEVVGGARGLGSTPLVKTQFNMVTAPIEKLQLNGLKVDQFDFDHGTALADFTLNIDFELFKRINVEYASDLYDRDTAAKFIRHYLSFVESVINDPAKSIHEYRVISDEEVQVVVHGWNPEPVEFPNVKMSDLVAMHSLTKPDTVAVKMGDVELTYSDLTIRSNKLAGYLRTQRVQCGSVVGVYLNRSPDLVVVLLALMKLGATYVPLDPAFPKERILSMIDASGMSIAISDQSLAPMFSGKALKVITVDSEKEKIDSQSGWALEAVGSLDDTAYILFTSGSSGVPKGVEVSHRSLVNFLNSMLREPGLSASDTVLAITTLSFDISALELYLPLVAGARVVMVSREEAADGRLLRDRFDTIRPTVMQATPSTWRMLIDSGWLGSNELKILSGGEALSQELATLLMNRCGELWNVYGPTETTVWSTVERIGNRGDLVTTPISIGRPIDNTCVYVLDPNMQPVPVGVAGELYIGGVGVSKGYVGRPDLTKERFVANPFTDIYGPTLYRTGDSAKWLKDGRLIHLGRLDSQVKIRGYRIELEEIEAALLRHPAVKQAVVGTHTDASGQDQLVGYLILDDDVKLESRPSIHDFRFYLRNILPGYMVPSSFMVLDSFPLTANSKVNRKALPRPNEVETVMGELDKTDPSDPLELQLLLLWKQVLGLDTLGIHDSFFEMGGHSLKAVQLLTQVNRVIGRELPLATLFRAPTVSQMAKLLTEDGFEPSWRSLVAINAGGYRPPMFAVPGVGGNVIMFAKFAKLLGTQQPFYGLQARGLDGKTKPFTTISDAAQHNIEEIRSVYPTGPYKLLGVCTGGVIAYEMAQQLRSSGEEVVLMLADTWHPTTYQKSWVPQRVIDALRPAQFLLGKVSGYTSDLFSISPLDWPKYIGQKFNRAKNVLQAGHMDEVLIDGSYYRNQVADATFDAISAYKVEPYDGSLLYVVASKRDLKPNSKDTRLMWKDAARKPSKKVRIPAIDSGQLFVSPHVESMVNEVEVYLKSQSSAV